MAKNGGGWKSTFKRPSVLQKKERPLKVRDPRPKKETREDRRRFWVSESKNPQAKATKRSHGTKKLENRARDKRAKKARKVNR